MPVRQATEKLASQFRSGFPKWLSFIGHTTTEVVVYASNVTEAKKHVPSNIDGIPVVIRKSGKPKPA